MNIVYAFFAVLIVYPFLGTLFFALVERISLPIKGKVFILTFVHPILTGLIVWLGLSVFNPEVARTAVLLLAGSLIWVPFSKRKYFSGLAKELDTLEVEYITPVMQRKNIQFRLSELENFSKPETSNVFQKPSTLTVSLKDRIVEFDVLDKISISLDMNYVKAEN